MKAMWPSLVEISKTPRYVVNMEVFMYAIMSTNSNNTKTLDSDTHFLNVFLFHINCSTKGSVSEPPGFPELVNESVP